SISAGPVAAASSTVDAAEMDRTILKASIVNGALELLPESLSTMAIIPLQMRLVYGIGKAHGYELDRGHIKDFLATVGVGLTSQYLEQAGRKLLGGLLGKVGGGLLRGVGNQAVSSGMSFASTYALGHVAKRYYAGGRTLSTQMLKDAYADLTQQGQRLQTEHLPAIREQARTLDAGKVLAMVRGQQ
ncbi:MAG: GTPase, partial [Comamonadaceae bacterium]